MIAAIQCDRSITARQTLPRPLPRSRHGKARQSKSGRKPKPNMKRIGSLVMCEIEAMRRDDTMSAHARPGLLELRGHFPRIKRRPRQTAQSHEIDARNRVALYELEGEQSNHPAEPGETVGNSNLHGIHDHPSAKAPGTTSPS
jgi:hypothetical protein